MNTFAWKSLKLPRVVSSALGAESQIFSIASSTIEWMSLMIAEAKQGSFDLRDAIQKHVSPTAELQLPKVKVFGALLKSTGVSDCKSLFDHLSSLSSASKCDDKRIAIDLTIIKQCIQRTDLAPRWCPTELQLGMTKDQQDPADLVRAILDIGEYELNAEAAVLSLKKQQREQRQQRRIAQEKRELEHKLNKLKGHWLPAEETKTDPHSDRAQKI